MKRRLKCQGGFTAKRTYDIRIRNAVAISQNPDLFPELNIPRSTAREWIRDGAKNVVSIPHFDLSKENIIVDYAQVKNELHKEQAINRLMRMTQSLSGMPFKYARVASSDLKSKLLEAIEMTKLMPQNLTH